MPQSSRYDSALGDPWLSLIRTQRLDEQLRQAVRRGQPGCNCTGVRRTRTTAPILAAAHPSGQWNHGRFGDLDVAPDDGEREPRHESLPAAARVRGITAGETITAYPAFARHCCTSRLPSLRVEKHSATTRPTATRPVPLAAEALPTRWSSDLDNRNARSQATVLHSDTVAVVRRRKGFEAVSPQARLAPLLSACDHVLRHPEASSWVRAVQPGRGGCAPWPLIPR